MLEFIKSPHNQRFFPSLENSGPSVVKIVVSASIVVGTIS